MKNTTRSIKWFLYGLSLLALNYLVYYVGMVAYLISVFRGDFVLAAIAVVLVFPAIVLQPWFLVFSFIPGPFTPLLISVITVFVYGWLNAGGRLEKPKQFLGLKGHRILAVTAGVIVILLAVGIARYKDFPARHFGAPPYIRSEGLTLAESRYYCLGEFIDSEWLWQARLAEADLTRFVEIHRLHAIDDSALPLEFRSMPPYWWRPRITERTRFFSTSNFPVGDRGEDGLYLMAAWDPDNQMLHVWIKNNF